MQLAVCAAPYPDARWRHLSICPFNIPAYPLTGSSLVDSLPGYSQLTSLVSKRYLNLISRRIPLAPLRWRYILSRRCLSAWFRCRQCFHALIYRSCAFLTAVVWHSFEHIWQRWKCLTSCSIIWNRYRVKRERPILWRYFVVLTRPALVRSSYSVLLLNLTLNFYLSTLPSLLTVNPS